MADFRYQSWLQRTWRPITMLVFVGLIVARWLGWSAPNLGEAEVLKLWDIVEIGLGGYVIGGNKCLECMNWVSAEVRECTDPTCPLFAFQVEG